MTPNIKRLWKVIEAVESAPDFLLKMDTWFERSLSGTAGCAIFHYINKNPRCGLRLRSTDTANAEGPGLTVMTRHFSICFDDLCHLFYPFTYKIPSRATVLRRLRAFVAKAEREAK